MPLSPTNAKKLTDSLSEGQISPSSTSAKQTKVITLSRDEHSISRQNISKNALRVVYELNQAGFDAYLVGGCTRDLMLGKQPKDFDVATNATPEQTHRLFRRSRIVGRRFKITHVRFGREVIEVTTFRAGHDEPGRSHSRGSAQNAEGMLIRDNVYGSLQDDALRRDFTVNALYYTVKGFEVIDYTGGLNDLASRRLRIIGNPEQRYREDPVRMLRAIRFAAKLNFHLDTATAEPIAELGHLLEMVSASRLFDEITKLFLQGNAEKTLPMLVNYNLIEPLIPGLGQLLGNQRYQALLKQALHDTDQRVACSKPVTPAFLFASLLWPIFSENLQLIRGQADNTRQAASQAGYMTTDQLQHRVAIPKRFAIAIREIWTLQQNLESAKNKRALALLSRPRFRAAYDFMLLREQTGDQPGRGSAFWTQLQKDHPELVGSARTNQQQRYRGRARNTPQDDSKRLKRH